MASSGLLTTITTAWGLVRLICSATEPTIRALVSSRSSRLMPGLPRHSGGDDHHVAFGRVVVTGRADDIGVEAGDRRGLQEVEGLALGHALGLRDIQQDDIAQFGGRAPVGGRGPDVAGADDRRSSHVSFGHPYRPWSWGPCPFALVPQQPMETFCRQTGLLGKDPTAGMKKPPDCVRGGIASRGLPPYPPDAVRGLLFTLHPLSFILHPSLLPLVYLRRFLAPGE